MDKCYCYDDWKKEKEEQRKKSGIVNVKMNLMEGDNIDEAYLFISRVKFSYEKDTDSKVLVSTKFSGVELNSDMTKLEWIEEIESTIDDTLCKKYNISGRN